MAALALILALLVQPAFAQSNDVKIKTPDGFVLVSIFKKPAPGKRTLVMLHGWQSVKEEWQPLIAELDKAGWGYLAYDSRQSGPRAHFVDDLGAALQFLSKEGIARNTVSLAGASLGANVVLNYAGLTGFPGSVVALSPGLDYQGLAIDQVITKIKAPILIVASKPDQYAHQSSQQLVRLNPKVEFWDDVKPGHGVQVFDPKFLARLVAWLAKH